MGRSWALPLFKNLESIFSMTDTAGMAGASEHRLIFQFAIIILDEQR